MKFFSAKTSLVFTIIFSGLSILQFVAFLYWGLFNVSEDEYLKVIFSWPILYLYLGLIITSIFLWKKVDKGNLKYNHLAHSLGIITVAMFLLGIFL